MSASPVVRVEDAPNWAATRFGLEPSVLDMRIMRGVLGCAHVGVSYLRFGPGQPLTVGHRHPGSGEEIYVLVSGRAEIKIDDDVFSMEPVSAVRVQGDRLRAIRAVGEAEAAFVVVGYPIDDPDETEIVPGFWPEE
jgi:hypothetical protein